MQQEIAVLLRSMDQEIELHFIQMQYGGADRSLSLQQLHLGSFHFKQSEMSHHLLQCLVGGKTAMFLIGKLKKS